MQNEPREAMPNLNMQQDSRYNLKHLLQYISNGISIYLRRRQQIIMHLGQDISDKQSIQNFNSHYFKGQDSLFEGRGQGKTPAQTPQHYAGSKGMGVPYPDPSKTVPRGLNSGLAGQQSATSIATEVTLLKNPLHTKTVHQDFGQVIKEDIVEEDFFLQ